MVDSIQVALVRTKLIDSDYTNYRVMSLAEAKDFELFPNQTKFDIWEYMEIALPKKAWTSAPTKDSVAVMDFIDQLRADEAKVA
tara:strand:+ start:406 stop:657 length:252 start_codon:yes stop_codon:yes gene_type:complete